ncbi:carboxypeptidase-like regulatory domain-containing protein [Bacteroides muris (ex Afrizal et al. 2022)]|uniref:carboxypeptidase-like regulatory domain-containing protein n=1 Tax=Bacteroides muris (ex Afrizal et al. 2022) TaxID=2516960 RepID=UPI002110C7DF|nr:carboxypeptidase-like regulatory domain-containing protein [Bacteroides muris (ex Afrizal et al. 2022)]
MVISAEGNEPIIGTSVLVKGSTTGGVTDLDGKFTVTDAPAGATTLQVSFVGMITQEVPITPGTIRVILKNDAKLLDEVVVMALGIAKKEKSLTCSTQVVNGDELARVKDLNMMNALACKMAGVQINKSSSGLGGSSEIIRGNCSVSGSGQPLYVIDGVSFGSSTDESTATIFTAMSFLDGM